MARSRAARAAMTALAAVTIATVAATSARAASTTPTLTVTANSVLRPVTHVASGSLYGLATSTIPSEAVAAPLSPNTFVQMAPQGRQLPNGETSPAGDTLNVLQLASQLGAKVVVRMPDWFPTFPYSASGTLTISQWLAEVDNQVKLVESSPYASSVSAFAIWNEPNLNWTGSITDNSGNPLNFNTFWEDSYQEIRKDDPSAVIQGPSFSDYGSGSCSASQEAATSGADCGSIQAFLQFAQSTNTVPNIMAWHELGGQASIQSDVTSYRSYESSIIGKTLPIAIEEYGEPGEVGVPGDLVGYIAKFERAGVNNAELAFWNEYGSLGDTLTGTGGAPNGAYWLYQWYGQMSGNMVTTTTTNATSTDFDGAASVSANGKSVSVIVGGNSGATQVTINGLSSLSLGNSVNVSLQYVPSYGRLNPVAGPLTISNTVETPSSGTITVPIAAMNASDAYRIVLTPAVSAPASDAGTYTITNLNSGLDLAPTSGATAQQTTADAATDQDWVVTAAGSNEYTIRDGSSGLYLTSPSSSSGAAVTLVSTPSGSSDLWRFGTDNSGHATIVNVATGDPLGVQQRLTSAQVPVIQDAAGAPTPVCTATGYRVKGEFGNAVSLCGDGEYVSLPTGIVSGLTGNYTISAWVKPRANTMWSRIFDFGTGTNDYMYLTVDNAGGDLRFAISTSGAGGEQGINSSYPVSTYGQNGAASFANSSDSLLPLNQWTLVTVTVSGTTGTLYVGGTAVGSNSAMTLTPSALGQTTQDWIGRSEYGDPYLNGAVDDFNIYNSALTASQVATLANGTAPGAGNVAHYTFDEATGATVADSSGNGRTATIVSAPTNTSTETGTSADQLWTLTNVTCGSCAASARSEVRRRARREGRHARHARHTRHARPRRHGGGR